MTNKTIISQIIKASLVFLLLLLSDNSFSQGINDMGLIWEKTYGAGKIVNIKPNKAKDGYIACGQQSTKEGLVVEFDESGKQIRRAVANMNLVYAQKSTAAATSFKVAFKTDDGGILAFGTIFDKGAAAADKAPNWAGKVPATDNELLNNGTWIVKFDKNLSIVYKALVRGVIITNGWQTSDGLFVITGMDTGDTNFTLLRKYNQAGTLVKDARCNYREISSIYNFPGTDNFIATTPSVLLKISAAANNVAVTSSQQVPSLALPGMVGPYVHTITPSTDGGIFIRSNLHSVPDAAANHNNGVGFYRLSSTYGVKYHKLNKPATERFDSPLLLPGTNSPAKYVGVYYQCPTYNNCTISMYELTDGATFNFTKGPAYPAGTALISVSTSDGFFTCGGLGGNAKIAKLSTCANFKVSNPPASNKYTLPHSSTIYFKQPINYAGAKADKITDVKYSLTSRVVTGTINGKTAGQILETITKQNAATFVVAAEKASGKAFDLNRTYTITSAQAKIEYTIVIHDNYTTSGVKQSCDQSYLFTFETALVGGTTKGTANVCYDTTPGDLTVENSGGGSGVTTYQWQSRANASAAWVNASGASTTEKYNPGQLKATTHYRRMIKNDGGTLYSSEVIVNVYPEVTATTTQVNIDCFGGTGSITVSGGVKYRLYNGSVWTGWTATTVYSNLLAGTYKVQTQSTDGCNSPEKTIVITQPTAALNFTTNVTDISCNSPINAKGKVAITISGGTSPYQYSKDGTSYTTMGGNSVEIPDYAKGTYTIYVKDAKGCITSKNVTVEAVKHPTGDVVATPSFSIDASGTLKIKTSVKNTGDAPFVNPFKITVYKNTLGNLVKHVYTKTETIAIAQTTNIEIEIPNFNSGQWAGCGSIVLNFNDDGVGNRNQQVCDETVVRQYKLPL